MNRIVFPQALDEERGEGGGGGRDYAAEASAMGWVPKERWTGDPNKWTDAQTFVERGEKVLPIVLQENKALKEKVSKLEKSTSEMQSDFQAYRTQLEKAAEREKKEIEARYQKALEAKAAAIDSGDGAGAVKADEDIKEAEREAAELKRQEEQRKKQTTQQQEVHPDFAAWAEKNPWFDEAEHPEYFDEANEVAGTIIKKAVRAGKKAPAGLPLFTAVEKEMKKRYPDLDAGGDLKARGGDVESDSSPSRDTQTTGTRKGKAKKYENLPPEAQAACDRCIKLGMITDRQGKTQAEKRQAYCDTYDWGY